jgi:hypothetical protein
VSQCGLVCGVGRDPRIGPTHAGPSRKIPSL